MEIRARSILKIRGEVKLLISIGLFFLLIGGIGELNSTQALFDLRHASIKHILVAGCIIQHQK